MSRFSDLQKQRDAQRAAWGIPEAAWGGDMSDELQYIPDEVLQEAAMRGRNPFNLNEMMPSGALAGLKAEAAKRFGAGSLEGAGLDTAGAEKNATRNIGKHLGPLIKKYGPYLAMAIPGVGPAASMAIAAGSHLAGQGLEHGSLKKIQPLKALPSVAMAGAGKFAMGKLGQMAGGGGSASGAASAAADGFAGEGLNIGANAASSGGGSFWETLGGYAKDAASKIGGGNPLLGAGTVALGALSAREAAQQRKAVEDAANYRNQLFSRGLGQAEAAYSERAPLRESGMAAIARHLANPRGLFQTPGDGGAAPPSMASSVPPPGVPGGPRLFTPGAGSPPRQKGMM